MSYLKLLILDKIKSLWELSLVFSDEVNTDIVPFEVDIKKRLRLLCSRSGWYDQSEHPKPLTEKGVASLCQGMKKSQRILTKLVFVFPYQNKTKGIKTFSSILQKLDKLKVLYLAFRHCTLLNDSLLRELGTPAKGKLPRLEYLSLDFEECTEITNEGLFQFGLNILTILTTVKGIILNLCYCECLTEEGVITFLELVTKSARNLEDLTVNTRGTNGVTVEGAYHVIQNITDNLKLLQKLTIDFRGYNLKEEVEKGLAPLQVSKSIRELNLYFRGYEAKLVPAAHEDIESLTLTFAGCRALTNDSDTFYLAIFNPNYKNLQQLTLIFCRVFDELEIDFFNTLFVENGAKFNNLKSLTIEILDCSNPFGDDLFDYITSCVRNHLKNLESLSMSFKNWSTLSVQNITMLGLTITKNLRNLKSLKLEFGDCSLISEREMNEALDVFAKYMTELKELELGFGIDEDLRIKFANHKGLRYIPIVRIY